MTNTQRHIDELYKTGKTSFRDNLGAYPDYVVEFNDLVSGWALVNVELLAGFIRTPRPFGLFQSFNKYATNELKQLCIDYYGEE